MKPAARIGDMHTCPMATPGTPPIPHVGGPVMKGATTVMIGMMPAARQTDMLTCVGPPDMIAIGSPTVLIEMLPAARMGDPTAHGGVITVGCPTVLIGESGGAGGTSQSLSRGAAVIGGTAAEQKTLNELVEKIRKSGPKGKAFIESLEKGPTKTRLFIAKTRKRKMARSSRCRAPVVESRYDQQRARAVTMRSISIQQISLTTRLLMGVQ